MSFLDPAFLRQLSTDSTPYRDPLALIDWHELNLHGARLPEQARSL